MSDEPTNNQEQGQGMPPEPTPTRPSSVTLREAQRDDDDAQLIERANRSALDALRIAYTLLSWIMVGLIGLFILSGFQSVDESERAVRLRFGAIVDRDLGSGFQFAYPAPIGELIKVPFGESDLRVDDAFFPEIRSDRSLEDVARTARSSYEPERDGMLITADLNLAHVQARVLFRRSDPTLFITNVDRDVDQVEELIRVTVERAILQAVSEVGIDDIVKLTPGAEGSIAGRATELAQVMLDRIESGVSITRIDLNNPVPPLSLFDDFAAVTSATAKANEARDRADQEARTRLNRIAGAAAPALVDLIDRYERATDLGDDASQAALLDAIDRVFLGERVQIDPAWGAIDPDIAAGDPIIIAEGAVSGEVTVTIGDAETYRRSARDQAQADLAAFRAKLPQFRSNPRVLIVNEWTQAMREFLTKETVQAFYVPPGSDFVDLELNRDPQIQRQQERERNRREIEQANRERTERVRNEDLELRDSNTGAEQ